MQHKAAKAFLMRCVLKEAKRSFGNGEFPKRMCIFNRNQKMITQHSLNALTYEINAAAIEVHKCLGPGLLESIYQKCIQQEFLIRGIQFQSELVIPLHYKGLDLNSVIRCEPCRKLYCCRKQSNGGIASGSPCTTTDVHAAIRCSERNSL